MKFEKITVAKFKKTTSLYNIHEHSEIQKFIQSFIESGIAIAEIKDWEGHYADVSSLTSSINSSLKRYKQDNIKSIARNKKPYIVNKLLYSKEIEKC